MFKSKKEKNTNLSKYDNNEQIEIANGTLPRKKSFLRKLKKGVVNNLPIISASVGTTVTLITGVVVDGFQCSDLVMATGVGTSSAIAGSIVKTTIKTNKYEKLQNLTQEPEESTEIDELQKELLKAQLRTEISRQNLITMKYEYKIQQMKSNNSGLNTNLLFNTQSSLQSDNWSEIINSSNDLLSSSTKPLLRYVN